MIVLESKMKFFREVNPESRPPTRREMWRPRIAVDLVAPRRGAGKEAAMDDVPVAGRFTAGATSSADVSMLPSGAAAASPSEAGERADGLLFRLIKRLARPATLALVDQAVVSATSFLTTIFVGRCCGADELGVYAIAFSLLLTSACVQDALIATPYTIFWRRPKFGTAAELAGSALLHCAWLSGAVLILLAALGAGLNAVGAAPGLAAVSLTLAVVVPFSLLREFGRRFAFAHLRMEQALAIDMGVSAIQIAGLGGLAWAGALSSATAYAMVGAASAVVAGIWLYCAWGNFAFNRALARQTMRQNWGFGRWLFASQIAAAVQGYVGYWALASISGTAAAGEFAACMTIAQFSNPLIIGIGNSLTPHAAHAFAGGGGPALRRAILRTSLVMGAAMGLFCLLVSAGGDALIHLLYRGPQYQGHYGTIVLLALGWFASAMATPPQAGLAAVERPDVTFKASLLGAVVALLATPFLVAAWGLSGAACGLLISNAAGTLARWFGFSHLVAGRSDLLEVRT